MEKSKERFKNTLCKKCLELLFVLQVLWSLGSRYESCIIRFVARRIFPSELSYEGLRRQFDGTTSSLLLCQWVNLQKKFGSILNFLHFFPPFLTNNEGKHCDTETLSWVLPHIKSLQSNFYTLFGATRYRYFGGREEITTPIPVCVVEPELKVFEDPNWDWIRTTQR